MAMQQSQAEEWNVSEEELQEMVEGLPFYQEGQPPDCRPWQTEVTYWDQIEDVWGEKWGAQGIGKLERALVSFAHPSEAHPVFQQDPIYFGRTRGQPDIEKCKEEQRAAYDALEEEGVELDYMEHPTPEDGPWPGKWGPHGVPIKMLTSAGTAFVIKGGAIIPRRGVTFKQGAEVVVAKKLMDIGCPILLTTTETTANEIGASEWLDDKNWAFGVRGVENNTETVEQARPVLERAGVENIHLTSIAGGSWGTCVPDGVNWSHINSVFNVVDLGLAMAHIPSLDYEFISNVSSLGVDLIEVPEDERDALGATLIEPGKIIMGIREADPPRQTIRKLEEHDVEVITVDWTHMYTLGGSIRCGIGPLIRQMPGPRLEELDKSGGDIISVDDSRSNQVGDYQTH